jgi:hypothetical protein
MPEKTEPNKRKTRSKREIETVKRLFTCDLFIRFRQVLNFKDTVASVQFRRNGDVSWDGSVYCVVARKAAVKVYKALSALDPALDQNAFVFAVTKTKERNTVEYTLDLRKFLIHIPVPLYSGGMETQEGDVNKVIGRCFKNLRKKLAPFAEKMSVSILGEPAYHKPEICWACYE